MFEQLEYEEIIDALKTANWSHKAALSPRIIYAEIGSVTFIPYSMKLKVPMMMHASLKGEIISASFAVRGQGHLSQVNMN